MVERKAGGGIEEDLLRGAVDLHAHGNPEISLDWKGRLTDREWAEAAQKMEMGGLVIKSHIWPTMERAYSLQGDFPGLRIFGSLTLNPPVGGLSPWAVESAIRLGAKVIWLPTWGARYDIEHHRGKYFRSRLPFYQDFTPEKGLSLLDGRGNLKEEVREIISMARKADLIIGTGHISPGESLKVAEFSRSAGFKKLTFTHPVNLGASLAEIEAMAALGAFIELTSLHILLQVVSIDQYLEIIRKVGDQRCILATDAFFSWTPPEPEMMRLFAGLLVYRGVGAESVRRMICTNPRELLGMEPA